MLNLKDKILSNKVLLTNISSLSVIQLVNFIIPIISLPYVVRILGPNNFGQFSFAMAIISYFSLLTDYGFNLSGVRDISVNRENVILVNKIFLSIFYSKVFLFTISIIILIVLIIVSEYFSRNYSLYIILLFFVLGNVFNPIWLYQGMEKLNYLIAINLVPRFIGLVLIFTLLKSSSDILLYASIISFTQLIIGIISFIYAMPLFGLKIISISIEDTLDQFKKGWKLFLSNISFNLYSHTNVVILGIITNESTVGIYSAADKIRIAMQSVIAPISQSVFPRVNYLLKYSADSFFRFNRKLLRLQSLLTFILSFVVFIFADRIVWLVLGLQYQSSVIVLKILSWLPFIISISNVYGIQIILSLNEDRKFLQVVISAALISIILAIILTFHYREIGTALTFLITEIYVSTMMFLYFKKILKEYEV